MTRSTARIELVRTLDEQNISSSIAYEVAHTGAVLVMDGEPYTLPDGRLDRERIHAQLRRSLSGIPEFGMRLMHAPLGITTPAWVPDPQFDPALHVRFDEEPVELTGATMRRLAGFGRPVLPIDRPLWDMVFTRLNTGEIALGARMHHVVGDGQWGFSVMQRLTAEEPSVPDPSAALPDPGRPPASSFAVPIRALRQFLDRQDSLAGGWHEYWRKPVAKRVKRVGARNTRPLREAWIRRQGLREKFLPPTQPALLEVDASGAARQAARLRGSLNDLLVAATMGAVDDDDRGIDVLVPVSHRRKGAGADVRNHVSMVRAHSEPGQSLAERVGEVRRIARSVVRGEEADAPEGRLVGYATVMLLAEEPRWFGDAQVSRVAVIPAGDPTSEISVFGTVYAGTLSVTVIGRAELDVDRMAARVRDGLSAASPASVMAAEPVEPKTEAVA